MSSFPFQFNFCFKFGELSSSLGMELEAGMEVEEREGAERRIEEGKED
jgi:hypothetical protein